MRVWRLEMERRRQLAMVERERCLDQRGDTRCDIHVTHVGFQRTNGAEIIILSAPPARNACLSAATSMGSPKGCTGTVRFDVGNRFRRYIGERLRHLDHLRLTIDAGSRETHLARTVVIDRDTFDHGDDIVAICAARPPSV